MTVRHAAKELADARQRSVKGPPARPSGRPHHRDPGCAERRREEDEDQEHRDRDENEAAQRCRRDRPEGRARAGETSDQDH
jgi:hypothetical protein